MSKNPKKSADKPSAKPVPQPAQRYSLILTAICLLYLGVHFIPDLGAYDAFGPQWLFIIILDFCVTGYILYRKDLYEEPARAVFGNIFSKLYIAFFAWAGLSTFWAINFAESWVCYTRFIATIIAFFNLAILLNRAPDLFKTIARLLSLILLIESVEIISEFLHDVQTIDMYTVILSLKGTTGNKNIFAASTVVKIPFAIYCIFHAKPLERIGHIIVLLLGTFTLLLVNARASYLSLILILLFTFVYIYLQYRKEKNLETSLYRSLFILLPVMVAYFASNIELENVKYLQGEKVVFGTAAERLSTVVSFNAEETSIRFRLWAHAIDYTKKHPLLGCGYGNWKIESIPYQRLLTNDLVVPVHAHNDYFEQFAEMGILGGLLYLSLFICIALFTIRTWLSDASDTLKNYAVFSFLAFIGYAIDAFFNFPMERPISQVFFVLITSINITAYLAARKKTTPDSEATAIKSIKPTRAIFGAIAILLLLPAGYIATQTYRSLVLQRTVLADLNHEPLQMDWKKVVPAFPSIPNLCATGQPIDAIKARYLYEASPDNYPEAFRLLTKAREDNPPIGYSEFLKANIYYREGKYDSAARNALTAFDLRPRANTFYQTLIAVLVKTKDTADIQKAFDTYVHYRPEVFAWNMYLIGMRQCLGGTPHLLQLADSAIKLFPQDTMLPKRKMDILLSMNTAQTTGASPEKLKLLQTAKEHYNTAVAFFGKGGNENLQKAADLFLQSYHENPLEYAAMENAGICFINIKNWSKAITCFDKELAQGLSTNGKPEYFKGVAQINIGKKDDGCATLKIASKKGWKEADPLIKQYCP